jgi:thiamine-phosphate pyrophosphorylase
MRTSPSPGLYALINVMGEADLDPARDLGHALIESGVRIVQLRCKFSPTPAVDTLAADLNQVCLARGIPLIINDHIALCKRVNAAGIHLGQDDDPPAKARATLGAKAWIGQSTHNAAQFARALADPDVDWVALGPIFESPTKSGHANPLGKSVLGKLARGISKPVVAIGGITDEDAMEAIGAHGAQWGACVSALSRATDPASMVRSLNAAHQRGFAKFNEGAGGNSQ